MVQETFVLGIVGMIGSMNFGDRAIDHFGRLTEPKHLTEQNAWYKTYDWNSSDETLYVYRNGITKEERPLTQEQYNDTSYTLNER